jgi:hypothetical protein
MGRRGEDLVNNKIPSFNKGLTMENKSSDPRLTVK